MIIISKIGKMARGIGKKLGTKGVDKKGRETILGGALHKVEKGKESGMLQSIPGLNWQLNPKLAAGAVAAYGAFSLGPSMAANKNTAGMGEMKAGEMSQMTGTVQHSPLVTATQEGEYNTDNMHHSLRNYGASGDIVFAMHNMR